MTQETPGGAEAGPQRVERVNKDPAAGASRIGNDVKTGLRLIVLLLMVIAALQLYFTIQDVIRLWVADQFIPLVNAVYYLLVIAGGIWLIRETFIRGN